MRRKVVNKCLEEGKCRGFPPRKVMQSISKLTFKTKRGREIKLGEWGSVGRQNLMGLLKFTMLDGAWKHSVRPKQVGKPQTIPRR